MIDFKFTFKIQTKVVPPWLLFFVGMLIMCFSLNAQRVISDTIYQDDQQVDEIIKYGARDSSYYDVPSKKAYLYGGAYVETLTSKLTAGAIIIDFDQNEVEASYILNADSMAIEYPVFVESGETMTCKRMRMNTETQKIYIEALQVKQDELFFNMGEAKRYPSDQIHLKKGVLTTCDQEEPHYHFLLTKGVVVPDKRIVAGPMNLWISGIPTPIGLPFAFIPQQKERTKGLLFPEFIPSSSYGFGIQNLGYFIPINEHLQTSVYANLYSRGSWGIRNELEYAKRYGFTGRIGLGYQQFNNGFPSYSKNNKLTVTWSHNKQQKSNPFWNFTSNVNFISDNTSKNNPDPINPEYFNNSFNSDINLTRFFPGKPLTMGAKISMRQNSLAQNMALVAPVMNINMTRIFPFKQLIPLPTSEFGRAIQRIGLTYNFETQNKSTFADSLISPFDFTRIGQTFFNGVNQGIGLQTTFGLFKNAVKINPTLNYGNKINFQQIEKNYDVLSNSTLTDTLRKAAMGNEFSFSVNATTVVYSYYKVLGKNKPIIRHLMTPSIGYRYVPKLNEIVTANVGPNLSTISYSPFERSIYAFGNTRASSFLNFGINNSVELKMKSEKDTISGYRKTRLIDQFSINGNVDFLKDSMNLSDLSLNLRISPFKWMNFVANGTYSLYGWNDSSGNAIQSFAWETGQGIGRLLNAALNTTLTLTSKKSREIIEQKQEEISQQWNADYTYFALHPEQAIYFDIPWKINVAHVFSIVNNTNKTVTNPATWSTVQTLSMNGDISFTKRWNVSTNINLDTKTRQITNMNLALNRNMHCWALSFFWTPIGGNQSFLLSIRNTSSLFRDAKIDVRRPPSFF
jgi:hypothetical protein